MFPVPKCPKTLKEVMKASKQLECGKDQFNNSQYMCLPNVQKTSLFEFCFDGFMGIQEKGNCLEVNTTDGTLSTRSCTDFITGCPDSHFWNFNFFDYPACQNIAQKHNCYTLDPFCPPKSNETNNTDETSFNALIYTIVIVPIILTIIICVSIYFIWRRTRTGTGGRHSSNAGEVDELLLTEFLDAPKVLTTIETKLKGRPDAPCCIACLRDSALWISGYDENIKLYNLQGELLGSVLIRTNNNWPWDITVTRDGNLVYVDHYDRSIYLVKNVENGSDRTQEWQYETIKRPREWRPRAVCCTLRDDLLVILDNDSYSATKVVRYSGSTEKQTIQNDNNNQPLYTSGFRGPKYICENVNQDICVADYKGNAIVVVNEAGNFRFRYTGSRSNCFPKCWFKISFTPCGIATDSHGMILTTNRSNKCIHILHQDGAFIRSIDTCEIIFPSGICVDSSNNIFVAYFQGNVKKIQYYK